MRRDVLVRLDVLAQGRDFVSKSADVTLVCFRAWVITRS